MPLRGIIFDMDGTLLDTERLAVQAWEQSLARTGHWFPHGFYEALVGTNATHMQAQLASHLGTNEAAKDFRAVFREIYQGMIDGGALQRKTGARRLLESLRDEGLRLGLATSTHREMALRKLESGEIRDFFDVIVCGDEVLNGKPAPDIYRRALQAMDLSAAEAVAVEDSPAGVRAASGAGLRTILIPDLVVVPPEICALAWKECGDLESVWDALTPLRLPPPGGKETTNRPAENVGKLGDGVLGDDSHIDFTADEEEANDDEGDRQGP